MIGFGVFIFPGPKNNQLQKNRTQTRTKVPISSNFLGIVFFLLGLEPSSNLLGHDNSQLPRANEHIVLSRNHDHLYTSRRYARRKREGRRLAWQMVFATKPRYCYPSPKAYGPCGEAMPTRGCGEGQQSPAADGWQGADATSMTPRCGVGCRLLNCSMLTRVLRVLSVVFAAEVPGSCRALGSGATHTHHTARPTQTLHIAPRWHRLTFFSWLP